MVDYYKILEISRSSSASDIKKSYRKLALKWHPDKNPDNLEESTKKFKEISEAYEVLIDDKKRKIYDQYGKEGLQIPGNKRRHDDDFDLQYGFVFRDPEDVFREFFSSSPFGDLFDVLNGGSGRRGMNRHHGHSRNNTLNSPFGTLDLSLSSPFSFFGPSTNCFSQFTDFSSAMPNSTGTVRKTSTSTRFINGKKITTQKVIEGGKETITFYENDVIKSKTVNGVPQSITLNEASTSRQVNDKFNDLTSTGNNYGHGSHGSKIPHTDNLNRIKSHHHHSHSSTKHEKTKRK